MTQSVGGVSGDLSAWWICIIGRPLTTFQEKSPSVGGGVAELSALGVSER